MARASSRPASRVDTQPPSGRLLNRNRARGGAISWPAGPARSSPRKLPLRGGLLSDFSSRPLPVAPPRARAGASSSNSSAGGAGSSTVVSATRSAAPGPSPPRRRPAAPWRASGRRSSARGSGAAGAGAPGTAPAEERCRGNGAGSGPCEECGKSFHFRHSSTTDRGRACEPAILGPLPAPLGAATFPSGASRQGR